MKTRQTLTLAVALSGLTGLGCVVAPPPGAGSGQEKLLVCHKGKTLEVAAPAVDAHLRHGDARGPCR